MVHAIAVAHGGFSVELSDLVDVGLPMLDEPENPERADKAVGMVSYRGDIRAGTRAVEALKPVVLSVRAFPVLEAVNIPFVHTLFDADGTFFPGGILEHATNAMPDEMTRREKGFSALRGPTPAPSTPPRASAVVGAGPDLRKAGIN